MDTSNLSNQLLSAGTGSVVAVILVLVVLGYFVVRMGLEDARREREQARRFRDEVFINLVAEWLVAYRQRTDDLIDKAPKSADVIATRNKTILRVITAEGLAKCGLNESEISRFRQRYADSVVDWTDTVLTMKVTEKLLREWAADGLDFDCMAELLLDGAARAAFHEATSGFARIYQEQLERMREAHKKSLDAVHESEMSARQDAKRNYEELPAVYRVEKNVEKALERAARPYQEALDISGRILERVELLLRREHGTALTAALWKQVR